MLNKIDSLNFKAFDRDTTKLRKVPVYNSKTDFSQSSDIFEKTKNVNAKTAKKALLGVLALAGGLAATAFLIKKAKPLFIDIKGKKVLAKADKIQNQANSILENSDKEYANALKIIQEAEYGEHTVSSNYANLKNIYNYEKFIATSDGSASSVSMAKSDFATDVNITYYKGFRGNQENYRANEIYQFKNKKLLSYSKEVHQKGKKHSASKIFNFKEGQLFHFISGSKKTAKQTNINSEYIFVNNKLRRYHEGMKIGELVSKTKESFYFEADNKLAEYRGKTIMDFDPDKNQLKHTAKETYILDNNGKLVRNR